MVFGKWRGQVVIVICDILPCGQLKINGEDTYITTLKRASTEFKRQ
jgi:hypothetical protein